MSPDGLLIDGVRARPSEPGRVAVDPPATAPIEVLVPAGVGVPGAEEVEFAAALVAALLRRGTRLPAVLDASAVIAGAPGLLAEVADRLEAHWEQEG